LEVTVESCQSSPDRLSPYPAKRHLSFAAAASSGNPESGLLLSNLTVPAPATREI
jgi:hypothetical protein